MSKRSLRQKRPNPKRELSRKATMLYRTPSIPGEEPKGIMSADGTLYQVMPSGSLRRLKWQQ